jgi:N6-adenosine-specific RNA methylase IME4
MELKINEELRKHIWPLREEEFEQLEKNILEEGMRDKIVVWGDTIIDGHNRYKIAKKHGIEFEVEEVEFEDIEEAKEWMDSNQIGRRNLNRDQFEISIGRRYNREKKAHGGDRKSSAQNDHLKTSERLAKENKVSPPTVRRYAKKAEEFDLMEKEKPELYQKIYYGDTSFKDVKKEEKKDQKNKQVEETRKRITEENLTVSGVYDVVSIDPPWAYNEKGGFSTIQYDSESNRGAVDYPTMTVSELRDIEIPNKNNSVMFLWTTHAFLRDAFDLLECWGFKYKATMVWDKDKMGIGRTIRLQCEFCLIGTCGSPLLTGDSVRDIIREARREHSRKPEAFYRVVDQLTTGRKLDYFSREKREGWDSYGIESDKF